MTVRVLICDTLLVIREGLRALVDDESDIEVVATTDSGVHAIMLARTLHPHVVLTGLTLRDITGIELVQRLTGEQFEPTPRVVVFATEDNDDTVTDVLHAGASGLLVQDVSREEMVSAIRAVAGGQAVLAPKVAQRLVDWFRRSDTQLDEVLRPVVAALTPRERQVLLLIGRGMQPEDIALRLSIGVATVRTHIYRLRCKLDLKDRAQLVSFAYRAGLMQSA